MITLKRLRKDHEHRTWEWLSDHIDKLIDDDQKKLNTESLVRAASGKEQAPPKKGIPGPPGTRAERRALRQQQLQQQQGVATPAAPGLAGPGAKKGGKGRGKGDGGKGDGRGGKKKKGNHDGQYSGAESDGTGRKLTKDYPGIPVKDVP